MVIDLEEGRHAHMSVRLWVPWLTVEVSPGKDRPSDADVRNAIVDAIALYKYPKQDFTARIEVCMEPCDHPDSVVQPPTDDPDWERKRTRRVMFRRNRYGRAHPIRVGARHTRA